MHRRTFLAATAGAAVVGTAGCLGGPPGALAPASDEPVRADGTWNQPRGGPGHAGAAEGPGPGSAVESRWRYAGEDDESLRPRAVVDETVFAVDEGSVVAVEARDGAERWRASVQVADTAPVAVGRQHVFLPNGWFERGPDEASLTAYPRADGEVESLTLADGRLYYASGTQVIAIDPGAEEPRWTVDLADALAHRVDGLFATGGTIAVAGSSELVGLAPSDGSRRFRYDRDLADASFLNVAARSGSVYVSPVPEGPLRAVDAETGTEDWRYDHGFPASVAATDGHVVLGGTPRQGPKHRVEVLDAGGDEQWATPEEENDSTYHPPVVGEGTVYAAHVAGVFAYDLASGDRVWSLPAGAEEGLYPIGDLVVAGSGLFLRQDGDVYGLGSA